MRILSENRHIEMPYETAVIRILEAKRDPMVKPKNPDAVIIRAALSNSEYKIAMYSSEDIALKVMEGMRKRFEEGIIKIFHMPVESPEHFNGNENAPLWQDKGNMPKY